MRGLTRNSYKLLHQVGGKQHATAADHHSSTAPITPPASSSTRSSMSKSEAWPVGHDELDDFGHDPVSSDDDVEICEVRRRPDLERLDRMVEPPSAGKSKRSIDMIEHVESNESDGEIFSSAYSSSQPKRQKKSTGNGTKDTRGKTAQRKTLTYGSSQQRQGKASGQAENKKTKIKTSFKTARQIPTQHEEKPVTPRFKAAKGADVSDLGKESPLKDVDDSSSLSSYSSSPDSPEAEELALVDLTASEPRIQCDICDGFVAVAMKQDFEDRYNNGRQLNMRRQEAFCRYHKQEEAQETWREKRYPNIEWDKLGFRFKKQHKRLVKIMENQTDSFYRRQLGERISSGLAKTTASEFRDTSSTSAEVSAGYYGPRGQKAMEEHIVSHFGERLRALSFKDPLMSSSGVVGGVAGFVQKVLVPEMAIALVMEDIGVSDEDAQRVLHESNHLGDILNGEQKEVMIDADVSCLE